MSPLIQSKVSLSEFKTSDTSYKIRHLKIKPTSLVYNLPLSLRIKQDRHRFVYQRLFTDKKVS